MKEIFSDQKYSNRNTIKQVTEKRTLCNIYIFTTENFRELSNQNKWNEQHFKLLSYFAILSLNKQIISNNSEQKSFFFEMLTVKASKLVSNAIIAFLKHFIIRTHQNCLVS